MGQEWDFEGVEWDKSQAWKGLNRTEVGHRMS